jgi:hypothetical protein
MLTPLHDRQRAVLFRWGVLAVFAASALAPLSGLPSREARLPGTTSLQTNLRPLPPFRLPAILIGPDPFIPKAAAIPSNAAVSGVIFGGAPHALIEIGGKELIVGIGDPIGGARVVRLDDRGVYLSDGSLIPLRGVQP